eukprot:scaffold359597_cov20-Prasinocladus_malaysianus.AAC.1
MGYVVAGSLFITDRTSAAWHNKAGHPVAYLCNGPHSSIRHNLVKGNAWVDYMAVISVPISLMYVVWFDPLAPDEHR